VRPKRSHGSIVDAHHDSVVAAGHQVGQPRGSGPSAVAEGDHAIVDPGHDGARSETAPHDLSGAIVNGKGLD
jgi:hypothetical protein